MSNKKFESGRIAQKQRTRRAILEAATKLIAAGAQPTVTEAADAADVSRRTAYRYFPSQEKLLTEASLEGIRPAIEAMLASAPGGDTEADLQERIVAFVRSVQKTTFRNEALLRTMVHTTVLESNHAAPRRGSRRIEWIEGALMPLRGRLSPPAWERLVSGLALCIGIEAMLVLKDIRALNQADAIKTCEWAAVAMLQAALHEATSTPAKRSANAKNESQGGSGRDRNR